ncbi:MAG: hypothetical protein K8R88_14960 [Armatimonadetes bacterium]|nr:hypothetical protein [Armatimonadota bacterium]
MKALILIPSAALCFGAIYQPRTSTDPIASLIASKEKLAFNAQRGYLDDLLKKLNIDPKSQVLVFSKSSLQTDHITRKTPRAIYFNQDTYVAWIPDAPMIEIMSVDPKLGAQYYTLPNTKKLMRFQEEDQRCQRCHGGRYLQQPASLFVESSYIPESGYPRVFSVSVDVTSKTPIEQRWGGWYVTGTHGAQRHMGNEISTGDDEKPKLNTEKGANVTDLKRYFNPKRHLTPHSDIAALMVMEHQMYVQNVLSQLALDYRDMREVRATDCELLIRALLCSGETRLSAPMKGTSGFAEAFALTTPKDSAGRSLSELDLKTRLFKYPCSPLIYSRSFEALPKIVRDQIWRRFAEILDGKDSSGRFSHLSAGDRAALKEILLATKTEFKDFVKP